MNSKKIFFALFIFIPFLSFAQTGEEDFPSDIFIRLKLNYESSGNVNLFQDTLVQYLVRQHVLLNKTQGGIPGKKILIYMNTGLNARQRGEAVRDSFKVHFPDIPVEFKYSDPFFQVFVGNFRTRTEALKTVQLISKKYPKPIIVDALLELDKLN